MISATKAVAASSPMLPVVTAQTVATERGVGGRVRDEDAWRTRLKPLEVEREIQDDPTSSSLAPHRRSATNRSAFQDEMHKRRRLSHELVTNRTGQHQPRLKIGDSGLRAALAPGR